MDLRRFHRKSGAFWDYVGMAVSILCVIHCLLLPVAIFVLPSLVSHLWEEDTVHIVLAVFVIVSAALAFGPSYLQHRNKRPLKWMFAGLALVLFATFAVHDVLGHEWEAPFSVIGGLMLVRAHWINRRGCNHTHAAPTKFEKIEASHTHHAGCAHDHDHKR